MCDHPKRDLRQKAVMAQDPIGRVGVLAFPASDRAGGQCG